MNDESYPSLALFRYTLNNPAFWFATIFFNVPPQSYQMNYSSAINFLFITLSKLQNCSHSAFSMLSAYNFNYFTLFWVNIKYLKYLTLISTFIGIIQLDSKSVVHDYDSIFFGKMCEKDKLLKRIYVFILFLRQKTLYFLLSFLYSLFLYVFYFMKMRK